jgi:hypothetical protein
MYQLDTEEIITQILGKATQVKNNKHLTTTISRWHT